MSGASRSFSTRTPAGGDGEDGDDGDIKQEYVDKEFVARPYASDTGVLESVERSIIKE
jgi:hypothetical protein